VKCKLTLCFLGALWVWAAPAQEPDTRAVELFEAPGNLDVITPTFPAAAAARGEEGWVIVNFMVDEQGQAFEPMVVDMMGDRQFVRAALEALDDSKFVPASLSGKPITGSKTIRYKFVLEGGQNGASAAFASRYRRFTRSINADEQDDAQGELEALDEGGAHSLYEDAFLNLARYYYAAKYGSSEEQMTYLERALYFDQEDTYDTYLPEPDALALWPQLFVLQAQNQRFAEALATYDIIAAIGADEAHASLADAAAKLRELAVDDTPYALAARTDESGSFSIDLFKDEFYLDDVESNIDQIKLRCDQRYVFFEFEAGTQYKVPRQFGQCELEVLGDAGAGFTLVQL
jgi:TonB family protein